MIITRQDPFSFRLQTGETIVNFDQRFSVLDLKTPAGRFTATTPGEYEMEGIAVEGADNGNKDSVFYTIHWDDMVVGLGNAKTGTAYDILLMFVAKPAETARALANIEARMVIPFGEEKTVAAFLKERDEKPEEMEKLTLKKKDIPPEGTQKIVLLKPLKK